MTALSNWPKTRKSLVLFHKNCFVHQFLQTPPQKKKHTRKQAYVRMCWTTHQHQATFKTQTNLRNDNNIYCVTLCSTVLYWSALSCFAMHVIIGQCKYCAVFHCRALCISDHFVFYSSACNSIAKHGTVSHCIAMNGFELYCTASQCMVYIVMCCMILYCNTGCIACYCIALQCVIMYCFMMFGIVLYCNTHHCIILSCLTLCCVAMFGNILYHSVWHCIALQCVVLHCVLQSLISYVYCIEVLVVFYRIVLYCSVWYYTVLYWTALRLVAL